VNSYLPVVIAALVLVMILVLSVSLAMPVRRRTDPNRVGLSGLLHVLLQPALVLIISPVVAMAIRLWPAAGDWLALHPQLVSAWQIFWLAALALALIEALTRQIIAARGRTWPVPDLLEDILRSLVIVALAFTVLRGVLGWDIGPLLASTALLTMVLGFALQGVLGNLLAGMSLHLTRTVMQGDWVAVNETEGRVKRTNWRETRLVTVGGHELIVPNSVVAGAVVHNLTMPNPIRRHSVEVGASYSDAPDDVIAALIAAAKEVPEVLTSPAPTAFIVSFADYGINYRLYFSTRQFHRRVAINGEVCRHIWYKFKRANIEIPFPMSDKLLNDFMTVVYNQRKLEPEAADQAQIVRDLLASQLHTRVFVDADGQPLLAQADYEQLAPMIRRDLYTHGETLMRQGEPGDRLHVLVRGELSGNIAGAEGQPDLTLTIPPGAVVGEMSLLTGEPRSATLTTAGGCEILTLDQAAFVALLHLRPGLPELLADLAARRVAANRAAADQAREALAACPVHQRERAGILKRLRDFLSH